jgi:hypothetical protein
MRFGAVLPDEDAVRSLLRERSEELRAGLERVRGRVEIGVRAGWEDGPAAGAGPNGSRSGAEFMRAKLERRRAARSRADEIHPRLAELAADSVLTLCPRDDTAFTAAYLVERNDIERFAERANAVTVSGPWPPYSFSG